MTHTKDEALKLAKTWFECNTYGDKAVEVYEAIEQALAAPVQEPVAWDRPIIYTPPHMAPPVAPGRNHWEDGDVFERIAATKKAQP